MFQNFYVNNVIGFGIVHDDALIFGWLGFTSTVLWWLMKKYRIRHDRRLERILCILFPS